MKIIAIVNQKGGVGKTTTAINVSAGLGKRGMKVLLLDLDSQANATIGLGAKTHNKYTMYDVLVENAKIKESIINSSSQNVDLVPSSISLAGVDIALSKMKNLSDNLFHDIFKDIIDDYDYIIMDCPPSLGLINKNALIFADEVLITIQGEYYALEGLAQLLNTILIIKKMHNENLKIGGIIITMFDKRTILAREIGDEVTKMFREKVFKTKIPRNIALAEAPASGQSIFDYNKHSKGAKAYSKLVNEILETQN